MGRYSRILDLLEDDGRTFPERMEDVSADTIAEILGGKKRDEGFAETYRTLLGKVVGNRVVCEAVDYQTQGLAHAVEFDWERVWQRHLSHHDVIGWEHEHPPGVPMLSQRDAMTFQSWMAALDRRPRYAVIRCDGKVFAWELQREGIGMTSRLVRVEEFGEAGFIIHLEDE